MLLVVNLMSAQDRFFLSGSTFFRHNLGPAFDHFVLALNVPAESNLHEILPIPP
jgi:hypothetical protein